MLEVDCALGAMGAPVAGRADIHFQGGGGEHGPRAASPYWPEAVNDSGCAPRFSSINSVALGVVAGSRIGPGRAHHPGQAARSAPAPRAPHGPGIRAGSL